MSSHHGFVGATNNNLGLLTASSRRSGARNIMPFATAVATPTPSTCNINVAFSCGPYPLHQTTCNTLAGLTTSESTFTPLLVKSPTASVGAHILVATSDTPPTGATADDSVTPPAATRPTRCQAAPPAGRPDHRRPLLSSGLEFTYYRLVQAAQMERPLSPEDKHFANRSPTENFEPGLPMFSVCARGTENFR